MIKLFDIVNYKTGIKGYWQEKNKIYIDNVNILYYYNNEKKFNRKKKKLFKNGELAIFYIKEGQSVIEDKQGKKTILKHCIKWNEKRITKNFLKELLKEHNGLTIYKNKDNYTIEIWKK